MRPERDKKLTLQTGGCPLSSGGESSPSSTSSASQASSSGCCDHAASGQMASSQSPTDRSYRGCERQSRPPSTPPPLISPARAMSNNSVGSGAGSGFPSPGPPRVTSPASPFLHCVPYSAIGVASPPSPRCYDIIEEDMIFPMSDITEEDEEHGGSQCASKPNHKEAGSARVKSPLTIPTIITEDVDSEKAPVVRSASPEGRPSSWSHHSNGSSDHQAVLRSKSVGVSGSQHRAATGAKSTWAASAMSNEAHPTHYHTVHGTNHIGHQHHCTNPATQAHSAAMADGANSPVGGCPAHYSISKQRTRSHSGPAYPIGFTHSVRHSALISAGLQLGASSRRRQSDDSEQTSSSLRSRVSPSGSSFFDSFRPRSTSDSKSKKPSVITAIKNNFLNRGHNNNSNSSSSSSSSSNSCSNVNSHHHHCHGHHPSPAGSAGSGPSGSHAPSQPCACAAVDHQSNGCFSAPPLSPSGGTAGSVIDPFSLDFLYARSNSVCSECSHHHHLHHHAVGHHHGHLHHGHAPQTRPRSRSGSSGPTSTMARVLDIFRGRSNSIAATSAAGITAETCCAHRPTITHQDSICDREFEDIDENLVYVKFFKFYRCYDIVPISAKLVVFDTQLAVKKAFFALLSNGVRAAPLWDSTRHAFVGMLTITDFILILRTYYNSPKLQMEELEDHKLDIWRNMLKETARPLVSIGPDESLFNAIKTLIHNKVHRLPVIDPETSNVLYILTHKRILKFLFLYYYNRLPMPSYLHKTLRELPQIGTYENIVLATQNTPLIQTLNLMVDRRVSALPIVDKKNKVVEVYAKFDVIHLAADKAYQNLDIPVKKALEYRAQSERIIKCTMNDTLHTVLEKIVQAEVHRIIVVNSDDHVIGVISLSDLLTFLVLRPVGQEQKDIMATSLVVSQNIKCCKVVEETAEEVALSDCQSSSGGSSAADLTAEDRAQLGPDGLAGSLEEANQLTTSSTGSSSATSTSSMLDGVDRSTNTSPATSTGKNLSSLIATTAAKQTLIAPLQ